MSSISALEQRYHQLQSAIQDTAARYGQPIPQLLAVTKKQPAEKIATLYQCGHRDFAESYLQEALQKQATLTNADINWHFIGPIQSNKTRDIAAHFQWVHSVDRLKIAQRLSQQRPTEAAPLQICVQVNIDTSSTKSGVSPEEATTLCAAISTLPNLRLRGLMCIPEPQATLSLQRAPFAALKALHHTIRASLPAPCAADFDTLSMGMSSDYQAAIAESATLIRVGTALLGARQT